MLARVSKVVSNPILIRSFSANVQKICQTGILPEGNNNAYYGIYNLDYNKISTPEGRKQLIDAVKGFNALLKSTSSELKSSIVGNVSFGKKAWATLTEGNADLKNTADKLIDFPGYGHAPATQTDIYLHIHSKKDFATFEAAKLIINSFNKSLLPETRVLSPSIYNVTFLCSALNCNELQHSTANSYKSHEENCCWISLLSNSDSLTTSFINDKRRFTF